MRLLPTAQKLREDIKHGGRLGKRSTELLLELVEAMAARIDYLQTENRNADRRIRQFLADQREE